MREIIKSARDELHDLEIFVRIAAPALLQATKRKDQIDLHNRILETLGEASAPPTARQMELIEAEEKFATEQSAQGIPYLYDLAVVRLWGTLAACIDDVVAAALQNPESCKDNKLLARLKGPLISFRSASPVEQAEYLAETLRRELNASLKVGVGRFEDILDPIGMAGAVDEVIRKLLLELSQVRNVVVHKRGRVDKRYLESCPWSSQNIGDQVATNAESFDLYYHAAHWYLNTLISRLWVREGKDSSKADSFLQELSAYISKGFEKRNNVLRGPSGEQAQVPDS